jgi:hypothetical protein
VKQCNIDEVSRKISNEDMYVVLNKKGYDLVGEYITIERAFSTVADDIEITKNTISY